jgi:hypothetical protein
MDEIAREDPSLSAVERETVATGIEADLETEPAPASATQLAATGEFAALGEQELADAGELHALELADAGELAALGGQGQEAVDPGAEELAASCSKRKRVEDWKSAAELEGMFLRSVIRYADEIGIAEGEVDATYTKPKLIALIENKKAERVRRGRRQKRQLRQRQRQ